VAALTEIYHFLRLLYSKVGTQYCPGCNRKMTTQTRESITTQIRNRYGRKNAFILAPKIIGRKGFHKDLLAQAQRRGFGEARIDAVVRTLEKDMALSRYHEHTIELVVGRLPTKNLVQVVDRALGEGEGSLLVITPDGEEEIFSLRGICPACGLGLPALDPRLFSFNSTHGACHECDGLGTMGHKDSDEHSVCLHCGGVFIAVGVA